MKLKTCIFSFNIRPLNVDFAVQISGLIWKGDKYVPNFQFFLGNISYLIFLKNYELVKSICINLHLILATLPDHWDILKSVKQSRLPLMNFNERQMVMLSIENWRQSSLSYILTINNTICIERLPGICYNSWSLNFFSWR